MNGPDRWDGFDETDRWTGIVGLAMETRECADGEGPVVRRLLPCPRPFRICRLGATGSDDTWRACGVCPHVCIHFAAVRDKGDAWQRHVVDSLALLPVIERHAAAMGLLRPAGPAVAGAEAGAAEARGSSGRSAGSSSGSSSRSSGDGVELRLIDVGTGAGLPGMIIAAARPQWKVRGGSCRARRRVLYVYIAPPQAAASVA